MADNITHDSTEPARSDIFDIFFVMTYEKYIWLPVRVGAFVAHIFLLISSLRAGGFPIIIAEDLAANPDILLAIGLGAFGITLHILWLLLIFTVPSHARGLTDLIMNFIMVLSMIPEDAVALSTSFNGPFDICIAAGLAMAFNFLLMILVMATITFRELDASDDARRERRARQARQVDV